jgi:hypothetical protein
MFGRGWLKYYLNQGKGLVLGKTKVLNMCHRAASSVYAFRELRVWELYKAGILLPEDVNIVVYWKNGVSTYEYLDVVHLSVKVNEKSFKPYQKGESCNPNASPMKVASTPNRYSSATRKNYKKSYRSSRYYGRYRIQRHR